jgi:hypothetical protein
MGVEEGTDCLYAFGLLGRTGAAARLDPGPQAIPGRLYGRPHRQRQNVERYCGLARGSNQPEPRCDAVNLPVRIGRAVFGHKLFHGFPNRAHDAVEVRRYRLDECTARRAVVSFRGLAKMVREVSSTLEFMQRVEHAMSAAVTR